MDFSLQEVKEFWDRVAGIYERENARLDAIHNQRFTEAVRYLELSGETKVLNLWCRDGGAIPLLRGKNKEFSLINCELSPKMMAIGKKKYPQETFIECSLHEFPFPDENFDYVLSLETLEHVPEPKIFLQEVQRVLKKKGQLVMSLPPARAEWVVKIYGLIFGGHGEGPHRFLASKKVKSLVANAGLSLMLHKATVYLPLGNKLLDRLNTFLENNIKNSFLQEFAIRQFYICRKD